MTEFVRGRFEVEEVFGEEEGVVEDFEEEEVAGVDFGRSTSEELSSSTIVLLLLLDLFESTFAEVWLRSCELKRLRIIFRRSISSRICSARSPPFSGLKLEDVAREFEVPEEEGEKA